MNTYVYMEAVRDQHGHLRMKTMKSKGVNMLPEMNVQCKRAIRVEGHYYKIPRFAITYKYTHYSADSKFIIDLGTSDPREDENMKKHKSFSLIGGNIHVQ